MRRDGKSQGGSVWCEPNVWIVNGIFPVEDTDSAETATGIDPYFAEVIERLWRAVLRDPSDQAAYRRYECLPWVEDDARAFVARLSLDALKRLMSAGEVDWRTPPVAPTCNHVACQQEYLLVADEWCLPPSGRLWAWVAMALVARVKGEARWSALAAPQAATADGRPVARRWPQPRPVSWDEGTRRDEW